MLVNLGVGLPRTQPTQITATTENGATNGETDEANGEPDAEEVEPDDRQLLSLVIEELEERYAGEQGDAKIEKILKAMKTEFERAQALTNRSGTTKAVPI